LEFLQEGGPGKFVVGDLPALEGEVLLRPGDRLRLISSTLGQQGGEIGTAIQCTMPAVLADLRVGERVMFDEGRIAGLIRKVCPGAVEVEITQARSKGSRLGTDKGINFPDSSLSIPALTRKDLSDLTFAAAHADILSYSFVSRAADIEALQQELESQGREDLAVILKIETRRAFLNLPGLLLTAMRYSRPLGVMIARGDLAIECGWEELGEIQEEILRICAAAHIPCIWATQVLDEMARHGMPTRAEITDAAMAARAEAVMLNKGPNTPPRCAPWEPSWRDSIPANRRALVIGKSSFPAWPSAPRAQLPSGRKLDRSWVFLDVSEIQSRVGRSLMGLDNPQRAYQQPPIAPNHSWPSA
jgi:pyruvate kinase